MANNINTNLASRLFAYIEHKVDISQSLKDVYKSSIIFIGDEQQILIPQFNAYVGIGMTSYNNTVTRIAGVESDIAELKKELGSKSVKGINVQWGASDTTGENRNKINEFTASGFQYSRLSGNVTLVGENDYNENTGFAYRGVQFAYIGDRYANGSLNADFGKWYAFNGENGFVGEAWQENSSITTYTNATSGITITYFYETEQTTENGVIVTKPINNRIVIDDKKTWSYMLSSYAYTLNFARDYADIQVETLYHDLLGIGEKILVPVTNSSMWRIDPTTGNSVFIGGTFYEWNDDSTPVMPTSMNDSENPVNWTLPEGKTSRWVKITEENTNVYNVAHEHFKISTDYNNTYNMDISNGIQTLKEVAYILDQLSDGSLGTVTYLTKAEWNADDGLNFDSEEQNHHTQVGNAYTISGTGAFQGTYYRVYTNGLPTTNSKKYGYWINTGNPENLGIQIAYSIAGNTADIQDLHDHVTLAENGQTTLRSISHYNIPNSLVTMYQYSNNQFAVTDTNESLPNETYAPAYNVGDTRMYTRLDLALTYYTYNNEITISEHLSDAAKTSIINDGEWKGIFKKADLTEVYGLGHTGMNTNDVHYLRPEGVTYYYINDNAFTAISADAQGFYNSSDWPSTLDDVFSGNWNIWYVPEANDTAFAEMADTSSYTYVNNTFKSVDSTFVANNISSVRFYTHAAGRFTYVTEPAVSDAQTHQYYIIEGEGNGNGFNYTQYDYAQHAVIKGANKIATTTWVSAYMKDSQGSMDAKIENILAQAKEYTNEKINALDSDYKFSYTDFFAYWADNDPFYGPGSEHVSDLAFAPGTTAYDTTLANKYGEWRNWLSSRGYYKSNEGINTEKGLTVVAEYTSTYTFNKMRSEVISNVYEINGITYAESKELPTDDIVVRTNVWNDQRDNYDKMVVAKVTLKADNENSLGSAKVEALFAYIANVDTNTGLSNPKQVFAKYNSNKTYVKVAEPTTAEVETFKGNNTTPQWETSYWTLNNDGQYVQSTTGELRAFFLNDKNSYDWKQLYEQKDAYYEVIIDSIQETETEINNVIATAKILVPDNGTTTEQTINITCADGNAGATVETNLYVIDTNEANRTNYISANVKHYDYTKFGGHGQNRFNLDINVTHIEDATVDNTGLADAYDVQNFIANMFTWVNISASVTEAQLSTAAGFYTPYSTIANTENDTTSLITGKKLYAFNYSENKYELIWDNTTVTSKYSTYAVAHLGKNIDGDIVAANAANVVAGSEFYALAYDGGSQMVLTYTRTQEAWTNPLNMTLTNVK